MLTKLSGWLCENVPAWWSQRSKRDKFLTVLVAIALGLCGSCSVLLGLASLLPDPPPTPTATIAATATALPTRTNMPSRTPEPTETERPTQTARPTSTVTATPKPTVTPSTMATAGPTAARVMRAATTKPAATPTPTQAPPTATITPEPTCSYAMKYAADVTIPDGTVFDPGEEFKKTWAVVNAGTCPWDNTFRLAFVSGERMSALESVNMPATEPGATVNVSVPMAAPEPPGDHKGVWQLCGPDECYGGAVTVHIRTKGAEPPTAVPAPAGGGCAYIGNRSSMVFHHPGCSSVGRMSEHNKVCLGSREEAISRGFRPCGRCHP